MDSFYRHLDIYINTSVYEGIPMSILEVMSLNAIKKVAEKFSVTAMAEKYLSIY